MTPKTEYLLLVVSTLLCAPGTWAGTRSAADTGAGPEEERYGAHILSVMPVTAMDYRLGIGLSYEQLLGKAQRVGIILPGTLMLNGYERPGYRYNKNNPHYPAFYFTPGIKIYPFGQRRATYAFGPSFMFCYGKEKNEWYHDYPVEGTTVSWLKMAAMFSNYANFQVTKWLSLGLEIGLGMRFIDRQRYLEPGTEEIRTSEKAKPSGRFALSLGCRF